jgi:carbamoyltransferase
MRVLGISPLDKDATASFLEDGKVVFACGEERLSRVKLQDGFPQRAIEMGLERTGWAPESIDAVAYAFFDAEGESKLIDQAVARDAERYGPGDTAGSLSTVSNVLRQGYSCDRTVRIPGIESEDAEFVPRKALHKRMAYQAVLSSSRADWLAHRKGMREWVQAATTDHRLRTQQLGEGLERYGWAGKLRRFNHHSTHAANAFYASGMDEALIVTLDGYGSGSAGGVYQGGPGGIKNLIRFAFPNSLGQFYEHVTSALGFKPSRHEGKIVGLAAYGDPSILAPALLERFDTSGGDILMRSAGNYLFARSLANTFAKRDVAAAYQQVLEVVATRVVGHWLARTGMRNLVLSGGVHANVKLNQRLRALPGVDRIFVYPNMGDGGCGTGAAMLSFADPVQCGPLSNVYWGPDYSEADIARALQAHKLSAERFDDLEERVGELLGKNAIVGRFNGRMEYGPRALGNRSVLYPAKEPAVNQWLNHQLGRTEFMPFAPSALASEARSLFHNLDGCEKAAEFMTLTFDCTERMKAQCPAAVHIDGTARPQLVTERSNPSFHRILTRYNALTGTPALINTSFNMHEEPIVCSPDDAIRAFVMGRLDYLAIGPFLVRHPDHVQIDRERAGARPGNRS